MIRLAIIFSLIAFASVAARAQNINPCQSITNSATTGQVVSANSTGTSPECKWITPSGATIPTTTNILKGDGAGNAAAVSGTSTNCVLVDGTSTPCASGTVTSVTGTAPVQSSGGTTPAISVNGLAGITGAVKANGSGAVTQAACADLSNAGTGCTGAALPSGTGIVQVIGGVPSTVSNTPSGNCVLANGTNAPCDAPGQGAVGNATPVTANANSTSAQALMEIAVPTGLLNVATGASNGTALIHGSGIFTIQTLQVPTIAITTKICTVSGCGSGTVITLATNVTTATVAATANTWNLNLKVATVATGSSGTLLAHGPLAIDIGATSAVADSVFNDSNTAATSAINLTGILYVDFFITFSAQPTTPFNSFTQQVGSIEPASAIGPTGAIGANCATYTVSNNGTNWTVALGGGSPVVGSAIAAATSQEITLFSLPSNGIVIGAEMHGTTGWSGTGFTAFSGTVDDSVGGAGFFNSGALDLTTSGNTAFSDSVLFKHSTYAGSTVQLGVTANQNLNAHAITGSTDVRACYVTP